MYCWHRDPRDPWSDEHVIPEGIGGKVRDGGPFILRDVRAFCNNSCGLYVDGPYIRSWFTTLYRAGYTWRCVDLKSSPALPLADMGRVADHLPVPDTYICEAGLGPGGDQIDHVHKPYPPEPDQAPTVGRPVRTPLERIDKGFTVLFISATNPDWYPTILKSVAEHFRGSRLYLATGDAPPNPPDGHIPAGLSQLHHALKDYAQTPNKHVTEEMNPYFSDRFEAKVALGLGALGLAPAFRSSTDGGRLRDILWCKDDVRRQQLLTGTGALQGASDVQRLLTWPNAQAPAGHTILLKPIGNTLSLVLLFFGRQGSVRPVPHDRRHWEGRSHPSGVSYLIMPGLQRYAGPVALEEFIAWRFNQVSQPALDSLQHHIDAFPPYAVTMDLAMTDYG